MKRVGKKNSILKYVQEMMENLVDNKYYDVEIKEHREKRSMSQNDYFHVLVDKYADWVGESKIYVKNDMIARYGQSQGWKVEVPVDYDPYTDPEFHLRPTDEYTNVGTKFCIVMRGSHTYDSKEMSILIDGTIKEIIGSNAPIETMTPEERKRKWNY